jgi:hypothetical protein
MAFSSALVDRAVRIRKGTDGTRVEGTTNYVDEESASIKVRLDITAAAERIDEGHAVVEPGPSLLVYKRDLEGNYLDWKATDRIRVTSQQLGTDTWEIAGEPVPLRKKRRIIGWQLPLKRVEENY